MKTIEYDLPIFEDEDISDLNEYSKQVANAIKTQIDKFGNPIAFQGTVGTLEELQTIPDVQNGYIYAVTSENKNYIYNGSEWVVYSDNAVFKILVVSELPTENIEEQTIYFVPKSTEIEDNIYNEYIYVNGKWELIGSTEIDASKLTVNLVENSYEVIITETVEANGIITIPATYKVGADRLDVYLNGDKLVKAEESDTEGHYYEVGAEGELSNTIQITSDWQADIGDVFEFVIRTNGQGVEVESDTMIVSSIEPTTKQKVWLQKGKNLYNKNTKIDGKALNVSDGTTVSYANRSTSDYIEVMPNTDYVISCSGTEMIVNIVEYTEDKSYKQNFIASQFTTSNDTKYIRFYSATDAMETAQLEAGTTVTEYEEYTEPAIYVKNDNGVYEEFINKEDLVNYSTGETRIGTWIDGKPLYRKTIKTTTPTAVTNGTDVQKDIELGIENVDIAYVSIAFLTVNNGTRTLPFITGDGYKVRVYVGSQQSIRIYNSYVSYSDMPLYITIEYTKITD